MKKAVGHETPLKIAKRLRDCGLFVAISVRDNPRDGIVQPDPIGSSSNQRSIYRVCNYCRKNKRYIVVKGNYELCKWFNPLFSITSLKFIDDSNNRVPLNLLHVMQNLKINEKKDTS